jgi:hypothetical protein
MPQTISQNDEMLMWGFKNELILGEALESTLEDMEIILEHRLSNFKCEELQEDRSRYAAIPNSGNPEVCLMHYPYLTFRACRPSR